MADLEKEKNEKEKEQFTDITLYTSFLFLINTILAFFYNQILYSILFFFLFITSVLYRTLNRTEIVFMIDKFAILLVTIYGGYVFFYKFNKVSSYSSSFIISTFLLTVFLFYYGYLTDTFCYDPEPTYASRYHCLLHLISCIGHNLIIVL